MMRRLDDGLAPDRAGGVVRHLLPGTESPAGLVAGVNGAVGCLTWEAEDGTEYVPANGSNDSEVDYFTWHGHHFVQPVGAEVAVKGRARCGPGVCRNRSAPHVWATAALR
ncbi:hypothetical protein FB384_003179 [Prauserella sediminis]|uniref:Uncharacterized protein n=1 Tax=Prauserella sediminis TaxID=577680 RepID=A0A839XWW3_9PSEU|nr:hypothetical protein [Prauserella sediminis]MBB3664275.1 hypothetical protein [Prauserella sediminis]